MPNAALKSKKKKKKKKKVVHICDKILAIKQKILPSAATWMDVEDIMLSEISQKGKEKHCMILFSCGLLKIQQTSEYSKKRVM